MITKKTYIEYLIHTPINYTATNLADHLSYGSHDTVSDFLNREKGTARYVGELSRKLLVNDEGGYLILDDSVQDKNYSRKIELVKKQWSGNAKRPIRGIGVINLVHYHPESKYLPIDYRIYNRDADGKTKNEHAREMILRARSDKGIVAPVILMDSFYSSMENLKLFHRLGFVFVSQLKSNRLVSLSKEGGYIHMQDLVWDEEALKQGISVKLKDVPFRLQLFKVVAPNGDIDWVITNHAGSISSEVVQEENNVRWKIEEMHRELKQLTGIEHCQARKARAQRNHISYCYQAWFALKKKARETGESVYALRNNLFREYLKTILKHPIIPAHLLSS